MSLKAAFNTKPVWEDFLGKTNDKIDRLSSKLAAASDPIEIYRLQGRIMELKSQRHLRDELNGKSD